MTHRLAPDIERHLAAGEPVVLVTVARAQGSTPRVAGTPLVMCPIGISSSVRQGHKCAHMRCVTCPCNALTALAERESFRPSTVMQTAS